MPYAPVITSDNGERKYGQVVLRGGFNAQMLAAESLQGALGNGGVGTHERIMSLIHQNFTQSLNMTVQDLLSHPTMRGRQIEAAVIESCIDDYWTLGWKDQLDAIDRSVRVLRCAQFILRERERDDERARCRR